MCANRFFEAAAGLPPVRLLVNNAARFAPDALGSVSADEFDAHMAVNVRAPLLLIEAFAAAHALDPGGADDALVVNLLDAKLAAPNPDFLSYTLSKYALAGLTELAARALAPRGIRVNGIAPALMLRSAGQSEENFAAMQSANPLGRGVAPDDVDRRAALSDRVARGDRRGADDRWRAALLVARPRRAIPGAAMSASDPKLVGLVPDHLRVQSSRILLDSLEVQADIGFHEFEIGTPQRLLITVEIWLEDVAPAGRRRPRRGVGL